jgi:23S rRNA pseudoU1915 N3-methylase RlmH
MKMHKITLYLGGKHSSAEYAALTAEYIKRLEKWAKVTTIYTENPSPAVGSYLICLDSRGESVTTELMAIRLKICLDRGQSVSVIIGGAYGIADDLIKKSDMLLAYGRTTFPHELARLMTAEQLYRAFSVIYGSKYHHQ